MIMVSTIGQLMALLRTLSRCHYLSPAPYGQSGLERYSPEAWLTGPRGTLGGGGWYLQKQT